jgi:hypothetical protein
MLNSCKITLTHLDKTDRQGILANHGYSFLRYILYFRLQIYYSSSSAFLPKCIIIGFKNNINFLITLFQIKSLPYCIINDK